MNALRACGMALSRGIGFGTGWGIALAIVMLLLQAVAPHLPAPSSGALQRLFRQLQQEAEDVPAPAQPPAATGPTLQDVLDACLEKTS